MRTTNRRTALIVATTVVSLAGIGGMAMSPASAQGKASGRAAAGVHAGAASTSKPQPDSTVAAYGTALGLTATQTSCVAQLDDDLNTGERVGQLLWVGLDDSVAPSGVDALVKKYHLGGIVLLGGYHNGRDAVASITAHLRTLPDPRVQLFISADQEGGYVQQLQGSGFSTMPSAYYQGTHYSQSTLLATTTKWAKQLRVAGVNVNLAPVADTVAKSFMSQNGPIGHYLRNYDTISDRVSTDVATVVKGMHAGGVAATVKHFPGLGRVTNNTDTSTTGITDNETSTSSTYLNPFKIGAQAGADFVMVSSAWYPRMDPKNQAMFSYTIITDVLRGQLGYKGVVITDDVGNAAAVQWVPVGSRATRDIISGGDIVLTANPSDIPTMVASIETRRQSSSTFRSRFDASVLRVLTLKTARGLTSCS